MAREALRYLHAVGHFGVLFLFTGTDTAVRL